MPFKPEFSITPKINKALVEIERVRGFLDAVKLKDDWLAEMQKKALILESYHSTHIEGTALSLEQAQSILEDKKLKGINRDDEKELLNYKEAMDLISKYLGKDDPITEGIIRELHKVTVKSVRGNKAAPRQLPHDSNDKTRCCPAQDKKGGFKCPPGKGDQISVKKWLNLRQRISDRGILYTQNSPKGFGEFGRERNH